MARTEEWVEDFLNSRVFGNESTVLGQVWGFIAAWLLMVAGILFVSVVVWVVLAVPAWPQAAGERCGPYEQVVEQLEARFGERLVWTGVRSGGQLADQLWLNPETGTWTLLATNGAFACLTSEGPLYVVPAAEPEGEPA